MAKEATAESVTVALCTIGRPSFDMTLKSIAAGDVGPIREVIVMDNTAIVGKALDHQSLRQLVEPVPLRILNGGGTTSKGRNGALAAAATDVVLFVDDDCLVAHDWAHEMAMFMTRHLHVAASFGAVSPVAMSGATVEQEHVPGLGDYAWGHAVEGDKTYWCPAVTVPEWTGGIATAEPTLPSCIVGSSNNMSLRRSLLFDDRPAFLPELGPGTGAGSGEDTELGYYLMATGRKVAYVPQAKVTHDAWLDANNSEDVHRCYARGTIEALGHHIVEGDERAAVLLGRYLRYCATSERFDVYDVGSILAWAYGNLRAGGSRSASGTRL